MTIRPQILPRPCFVRRATVTDAPACAKIVDDWIEATPWMPRDASFGRLVDILTEGMAIREIYVAGDPVEGYLAFNPETAVVTGFYCASPGRGVGKALLDRIKEGRDFLQLYTHAPNLRAQAFYVREGFVACETKAPVVSGQPFELRMEWQR